MKLKNFKNKIIAILIMSVAFVIGVNAQTCGGFSSNDFKNLACAITKDTLKVKTVSGGGTSLRQSSIDSINHALYYSGIGSSASNLISENNAVMTSVLDAVNSSLDSLHRLIKNTFAVSHGLTDYFRSDTNTNSFSILPFINNAVNGTESTNAEIDAAVYGLGINDPVFKNHATGQSIFKNYGTQNGVFNDTISGFNYSIANEVELLNQKNKDGGQTTAQWLNTISSNTTSYQLINSALFGVLRDEMLQGSGQISVFKNPNTDKSLFASPFTNKSYFDNTALTDTLIQNTTSMASLVTAVNLFYAQHPTRQIKDVSYTNAVVTATLTFFAVIRFED